MNDVANEGRSVPTFTNWAIRYALRRTSGGLSDGACPTSRTSTLPGSRGKPLRGCAIEDQQHSDVLFRRRVLEITNSYRDPVSHVTRPRHKMRPARACELPHIEAIFMGDGT